MNTFARRAITCSAVALGACVVTTTLPLLVTIALAIDGARWIASRRPWMATRLTLFLFVFLLSECVGLSALALAWLFAGAGPRRRERLLRMTWRVQCEWVALLLATVRRLFGLSLDVDGLDATVPGPILVFARHCSIIDTLLPTVLLSRARGYLLRFVLKRELRWDPCIDVAGSRLPNAFVGRDGADSATEIAAVRALASDLGPSDGVLLYPEGTRFTSEKRRRILERLQSRDAAAHARAQSLRHLLPLRLGGATALLDGSDADVVFLAHTGLEGFASVGALFRQGLARGTLRVRAWRVARSEIPTERSAREAWLHAEWQRLDDTIEAMERGRPS